MKLIYSWQNGKGKIHSRYFSLLSCYFLQDAQNAIDSMTGKVGFTASVIPIVLRTNLGVIPYLQVNGLEAGKLGAIGQPRLLLEKRNPKMTIKIKLLSF